jgi:hypothetical protein
MLYHNGMENRSDSQYKNVITHYPAIQREAS